MEHNEERVNTLPDTRMSLSKKFENPLKAFKKAAFISLRCLQQARVSRSKSKDKKGKLNNLTAPPLMGRLARIKEIEKEWNQIKNNLTEQVFNTTTRENHLGTLRSRSQYAVFKARSLSRSKGAEVMSQVFKKIGGGKVEQPENVEDDLSEEGRYPHKKTQQFLPTLKHSSQIKASRFNITSYETSPDELLRSNSVNIRNPLISLRDQKKLPKDARNTGETYALTVIRL